MQQSQHRKSSLYKTLPIFFLLIYSLLLCSTCNAVPKYFYIVNKCEGNGRCESIWERTKKLYDQVAKSIEKDGINFDSLANATNDTNTFFIDTTGASACIDQIFTDNDNDSKALLTGSDPVTYICFSKESVFGQLAEALYKKRTTLKSNEKVTYHISYVPCGTRSSICKELNIPIIPPLGVFTRKSKQDKKIKSALKTALIGEPAHTSMFAITPLNKEGKPDTSSEVRYATIEISVGPLKQLSQYQKQARCSYCKSFSFRTNTNAEVKDDKSNLFSELKVTGKLNVDWPLPWAAFFIAGTTTSFFQGKYKVHKDQYV